MQQRMPWPGFGRTLKSMLRPVREAALEPILYPTQGRLRMLAASIALGHPLFYWVWGHWLPQPYESAAQRLALGGLGLGLVVYLWFTPHPVSSRAALVNTLVFWAAVPLFMTWMYFCNERNTVWLATLACMVPLHYLAIDWRIATVSVGTGLLGGWVLFLLFGPATAAAVQEPPAAHAVVLGFSWFMGLQLGASSSSLRREQLKQALGTMGIMAHELRTPLATIAMVGDALRPHLAASDPLVARLQTLVRHMNRQIDMQISNAQLMSLPSPLDAVPAARMVRAAVQDFPFRTAAERACVEVRVVGDFEFLGNEALFTQVIANLVKNALRALAAQPTPSAPGDLAITIDVQGRRGRITVADRGPGIAPAMRARLFQLFASTHEGTGHGLGLAFCQRVVQASQGRIRVESPAGEGCRFIIDLPAVPAGAQGCRTGRP